MKVSSISAVNAPSSEPSSNDRGRGVEDRNHEQRGRRREGRGRGAFERTFDSEYANHQSDKHAAAVTQKNRRGGKVEKQKSEERTGDGRCNESSLDLSAQVGKGRK